MARVETLSGMLEFAADTARRAGQLTLEYFGRARLEVRAKADGSPVTEADRKAEQLIRERIGETFPDHGIFGEEFGEQPGHPGQPGAGPGPRHRWIIDPIDGTKSFIHGVPLYGVMIALTIENAPALGVVHFPALGETLAAAKGLGCHLNDRRCSVDDSGDLAQATLLASGVNGFDRAGRRAAFERMLSATKIFRTWGDCYGYALVATGRAQVMLDPQLELYDAAPLLPILTEAGGRFTDWTGAPTAAGGNGVATNGRLHDQVLTLLREG